MIGKAKELPDAQAVNFRQEVICDAVVAAFQGNQDMISEANSAMKTTSALAGASLGFLKHQQERLKIEDEVSLRTFLSILCAKVLKQYYKRTKEQARSPTALSESNDRMVPVNYLISKTELSHSYDVHKFVLQAERVAKWFDASKDSVNASDYEDAPYFCVIQSSGMGKTKAQSRSIMEEKTALDAATAVLEHLNTFYDKQVAEASNQHDNENIIFLCFDEAQVYLESQRFQNDKGAENVKHPAFLFRCIRLWLRQKKRHQEVIGCFSGTLATLASFRLEADPQLSVPSSRDFTPSGKQYNFYDKGAKMFPIFLQTTTMGCLAGRNLEGDKELGKHTTEYRHAIRHGRPLFELMEENGDQQEMKDQ
ncbi:unnamed protein product [Cylindrotheca closterium]|uniref:Uncharacterized protein n=1 Tax=Cylindrotheca closterium TaxID=2856 RepID=A0AAD2G741_9STRA|nr:unnamed protein product [Cylindrotheca closterium]